MNHCRTLLGILWFVLTTAAATADELTLLPESPGEPVTLMGMLHEWIYPDASFHGATSSDAGVTNLSAIKSQALLTTPDTVEQVLTFYCQRLKVTQEGRNLGEREGERITTQRSVLIQDASNPDDAAHLVVIAVNAPKRSTTVVISRTAGADETRIAWSNYRQLAP